MKRLFAISILMLLLFAATAFADSGEDYGARGALSWAPVEAESLSLPEMMRYAIQDEYLARVEYDRVMEEFGSMRPFSSIIRSEEKHIEWLVDLFAVHGLPLPADGSASHVVIPADLKSAFEVGVRAEIDNIAMYELFLKAELPDNVRDLFERLGAASENHLRAFQNNLRRYE